MLKSRRTGRCLAVSVDVWPLGVHTVQLFSPGEEGADFLASAPFLVPHMDAADEGKASRDG